MIKKLFVLGTAVLALAAQAASIPFLDVQVELTTVAITADGTPGFDQRSSSGGDLTSEAVSLGAQDIALSGAVFAAGLLQTSADISSLSGDVTSAVSSARVVSSFLGGGGPFSFGLDFDSTDFASGTGQGGSSLYVSLVSDGVSLFQDYVTEAWQFSFVAAPGSLNVLDLTLTSEVWAAFPDAGAGAAFSAGLVSITSAVPMPPSWLLASLGLGLLALRCRRGAAA